MGYACGRSWRAGRLPGAVPSSSCRVVPLPHVTKRPHPPHHSLPHLHLLIRHTTRHPTPSPSQIQRLPGLPSSFVALDTIMNEDNFITFEDTLGDPFEAPTEPA